MGDLRKTWGEYHSDIKLLIANLRGYRPDVIVPVMLGGLVPGAIIAKQLDINDVRPIDIEREGLERRIGYDVQGDIKGKKLLIIEDDLVTGRGPDFVKKQYCERGANVKIAAIYVSPTARQFADFYAEICERFPNYPWKPFNNSDKLRNSKP